MAGSRVEADAPIPTSTDNLLKLARTGIVDTPLPIHPGYLVSHAILFSIWAWGLFVDVYRREETLAQHLFFEQRQNLGALVKML